MDPTHNWLCVMIELLKTSPLGASVGFGFIQVILEKLVEAEFSCPCDSRYNRGYGLAVVFVPSIMVFLLMLAVSYSLKLWRCSCKSIWEALTVIFVPVITWLIIVSVDGRYFACGRTNWNGTYELIDKAAPQKWCKPSNSSQQRDSLGNTQFWYSESQFIGFCIALGLTMIYLVCFVISQCCSSPPENRGIPVPLENV